MGGGRLGHLLEGFALASWFTDAAAVHALVPAVRVVTKRRIQGSPRGVPSNCCLGWPRWRLDCQG